MSTNIREQELACRHFMMGIKGIGGITARKLMDHYGGAARIWELSDSEVMKDGIMSSRQKEAFLKTRKFWNPEKEWERLKEKKISMVAYCDHNYPVRLRSLADRPFALYYKGTLPKDNVPSVAVIGSRMCTGYGRSVAGYYGSELAKRGIQVISGMASGIDGIAQKSALEHDGNSYGILGCGVDVCYPPSNRYLYEMLVDRGGILSEFPPGDAPEAGHFPMRNRLISGLADLILVVEARERSGTRITVNLALEQGKEVYAVPGRVQDELSMGCNLLIREGAGIALDVEDVAMAAEASCRRQCNIEEDEFNILDKMKKAYNIRESEVIQRKADFPVMDKIVENQIDDKILHLLREKAMGADEIYNRLRMQDAADASIEKISFPKLQEIIAGMMMQGKVLCRMGIYEII